MVLPAGHVTAVRSVSLGLALLAAIVVWLAPGRRALPLLLLFGAWLAVAVLSLLATRDLAASLSAIDGDVLRSFAVFFVFYTLTVRLSLYRVWVVATAVGFGTLSVLAIMSFQRNGAWLYYYVPPLGDFATSAITVLPLLVGYLVFGGRERAMVLLTGAAVLAALIAGYLTYSRAYWLSLIFGLVLGAVIYAKGVARFRPRVAILVAIICVAAIGIAALASHQRGLELTGTGDREPIYSAVAKKIPHNPLTGTGYGHETDKPWYQAALPGRNVFHSHNVVLSFVDQMGPLGLAVILLIFAMPALAFWRALRRGGDAVMPALCGLVLLGCVFLKNNLDYFFWKQNLWLFFAHLGIYLGAIDHQPSRDASRPQAAAT